ncbi:HAD family hydrolase [Mesoaciditoga sp.]
MAVRLNGNDFDIVAKGVVFDKDGTLTQGMKVWKRIFEKQMEVAEEMNLNIENEAKRIFGVGIEKSYIPLAIAYSSEEKILLAASIWISHKIPWDKCRELATQIVERALEKMTDKELFEPVGGAPKAVKIISKFVPVAIATSDSRENVERLLKTWNLVEDVDYVITSQDVKAGKPAPFMLQRVCDFFKLKCSEVVMIGDNAVDVEMAKKAGTKVIAVGNNLEGSDGWIENFNNLEISKF